MCAQPEAEGPTILPAFWKPPFRLPPQAVLASGRRRRIAAGSARGTATSASWETRQRPWRTARAPICASFLRKALDGQRATWLAIASERRKLDRR